MSKRFWKVMLAILMVVCFVAIMYLTWLQLNATAGVCAF